MSRLALFFLLIVAPALSIFLALLGLETISHNLLGWFLLLVGIAYPAGGVIFYFIRREPFLKLLRGSQAVLEEKGDLSFWAILPGFLVVFFAPPLEWFFLPAFLPRTLPMQVAGLVFILLAICLRIWTRRHIRGMYTGHVEVEEDHQLVQSGPYRWVRHPGYSAMLLLSLGLTIGYSSWIGLAGIPLFLVPGLAYRIKVEENLLVLHFGEEYLTYASRTKKLIPGIW